MILPEICSLQEMGITLGPNLGGFFLNKQTNNLLVRVLSETGGFGRFCPSKQGFSCDQLVFQLFKTALEVHEIRTKII